MKIPNPKPLITTLITALLITICSACSNSSDITAIYTKNEASYKYYFSENDGSQKLTLSKSGKSNIQNKIKDTKIEYKYAEFFNTEEMYERFMREPAEIKNHSDKALDSIQSLTTETLMQTVTANNEEYMNVIDQTEKNGYEELSEEDLRAVVDIVVNTVKDVVANNPDIDENRLCCVLGNLTILYKTFSMDFAHVDNDGHLFISEYMYNTAEALTNENADSNILIHECVHLTQVGCQCEEIDNCTMRAGLSKLYDDYDNLAFFRWFMEGSTERITCTLTNDELTTYKAYVNYVCSLDMSTICNTDISSDYFESLTHYSNPKLLFEGFACDSKEDEYEILNMMASIETMQQLNDPILEELSEKYGFNDEDTDATYEFLTSFKPDVCMTFSKQFYYYLAELISKGEVTVNDACFLIKLFETTLDHHLNYTSEEYKENAENFFERYKPIREEFFNTVSEENGIDLASAYDTYNPINSDDSSKLNASMKCLSDDKINFLRERTEYYEDKIGSKVR